MKKKVLCFFSLIFYILAACSFLSEKIEQEMTTLVSGTNVKGSISSNTPRFFSTYVLFPTDGNKIMFEVNQGSGWNPGLRAGIVNNKNWDIEISDEGEKVRFFPSHDSLIITSASRTPVAGEPVEEIKEFEIGTDTYLIRPSGEFNLNSLPEGTSLVAQGDDALLLNVAEGSFPFFERRAMEQLHDLSADPMRVYSLTDIICFVECMPALMLLLISLLVPVALWGYSFALVCKNRESKAVLWISGIAALSALASIYCLLKRIDLPASLLPSTTILDWKYYGQNYNTIASAFREQVPIPTNLLNTIQLAQKEILVIILGTFLLVVLLVVFMCLINGTGKNNQPKETAFDWSIHR